RSTDAAGGEPAGAVTATLEDVTEVSFRPNGEPAASSATRTLVAVVGGAAALFGPVTTRRPIPLVPRSACLRSAIPCFNPASVVVPFRISSAEAPAGLLIALPEKM